MTWDTKEPRNRAGTGASQPQGWTDPGWWDEAPTPAPGETARPSTSVRAAAAPPLRRSASAASAATSVGTLAGSKGSNGSNGAADDKLGLMAARKTRSKGGLKARATDSASSLRFAIGFGLGVFGALFLASAVVYGLSHAYDGKIMPGVHVGDVDLSGQTRDEAIATLDSAYGYLSQGKIVVTTPGGKGTISYQDAGRGPDSTAMADAALSIGRGVDPLSGMALTFKTVAGGADIPVIVKLDPMAFETKLHDLTGASLDPPKDYSVAIDGSDYQILAGAPGRGIDEVTIATKVIDQLSDPTAPNQLSVGGSFVSVPPSVSAKDAQSAIDSANKMSVDVTLTYADKTWTIPAATVRGWIIFGLRSDGKYGPVVQPAPVATYVNTLAKQVHVAAIEPKVNYNTSDQPVSITGGTPGQSLNVDVTTQAIEAYLDGLGSTSQGTSSVALAVDSIDPQITGDSIKGFVVIGQVTTIYFPGESNGGGKNIAIPALRLDRQVIEPGQQFSFLRAMGPIDAAHGWQPGGVIKNGVSNHTGAIGGGICSASTTFFQAAAVAGLQIDERHAHYYWISRYALDKRVGLDATVYSNGVTTWDIRITNDTSYPIVIRSWTSGGTRTRAIHVQLWSLPTGRKTTFSGGVQTNIVKAIDPSPQYVPSLPHGAKSYRKEYPTNGFDTSVSRTVTDSTGAVIHQDTWTSHYTKVDGWLQIAGPKPTPTPTPGPKTPTPPPAATPTPAPSASGRRRRWLDPIEPVLI